MVWSKWQRDGFAVEGEMNKGKMQDANAQGKQQFSV